MSTPHIIFRQRPIVRKTVSVSAEIITPTPPIALSPRMEAYFATQKAKSEAAAAAVQEFVPSIQQKAFFDWVESGSGNLILQAVAGSGKTTTLIQSLRRMSGNIFLGAYGNTAAKDIKAKAEKADVMRRGLKIGTMHGLGYQDWIWKHKQVQVDDKKVSRLIDTVSHLGPSEADAKEAAPYIGQMVSFGKQFLMGVKAPVDNMAIWRKISEHFSADQSLPEYIEVDRALEWVVEVYRRSHDQCPDVIDFDDMLYAPLAYRLRLFPNDWVLMDEAQDANPARREYAKRTLGPKGRAVFCGDSRQAIFGFTGSGGDSLERIKEEFNCQELPLSVSYRCSRAAVAYVHQWVSHIEAHPEAVEGAVRGPHYDASKIDETTKAIVPWFLQEQPANDEVVICRYTAPLIQTAYGMIKHGVPCKVLGRDIGKGLITIARMWKISTLAKLEERLAVYLRREIEKARKAQSEKREQEVTDKVDTLRIFIDRCRQLGKTTIDELVAEIEALFADTIEHLLTLCTGHKAKGLEWGRVFWIQSAERRQPRKAWEAEQEDNLKYVIGTRTKGELVLIPETLI